MALPMLNARRRNSRSGRIGSRTRFHQPKTEQDDSHRGQQQRHRREPAELLARPRQHEQDGGDSPTSSAAPT